jgi:hypothetical protein
MSLESANYHLPSTNPSERCRDCQEAFKPVGYGNTIGCRLHNVQFVRYSHRCDAWHKRGTLL